VSVPRAGRPILVKSIAASDRAVPGSGVDAMTASTTIVAVRLALDYLPPHPGPSKELDEIQCYPCSGDGRRVASRRPPAAVRLQAGHSTRVRPTESPRCSHRAAAAPGEARRRRRSQNAMTSRTGYRHATGARTTRRGTSPRRTLEGHRHTPQNWGNSTAHLGRSSASGPAGGDPADQRWHPQQKI
jgi:hypothetical protein